MARIVKELVVQLVNMPRMAFAVELIKLLPMDAVVLKDKPLLKINVVQMNCFLETTKDAAL